MKKNITNWLKENTKHIGLAPREIAEKMELDIHDKDVNMKSKFYVDYTFDEITCNCCGHIIDEEETLSFYGETKKELAEGIFDEIEDRCLEYDKDDINEYCSNAVSKAYFLIITERKNESNNK